ncbi:MAG: hypothetical protein QW228_07340 [Candidatus Aenigmatarchaeota archaeon]
MIEIVSPRIPIALYISTRYTNTYLAEKAKELLKDQVEFHTYIHGKSPYFLDKQTKVPILITTEDEILEHLDLLEEKGIIMTFSHPKQITYSLVSEFLSITSQATARTIEDKILLIGIKNGRRPVSHLRENKFIEIITKQIKLEEEPIRIQIFPQYNTIKFKNIDQVLEELKEKLNKEAKEKIKPKTSFTIESLAPPKDGHVLMMLASGLVDGQYGNLLIKGTSKKITVEEEEEDGKKVKREVPKLNIKVLNTKTFEFFEIE